MNKNINSNLNNKFGKCCNCPGLMRGDMYFTNNISSRIYNDMVQKDLKINDSNTYRSILQVNAVNFMKNEINKFEQDRCKSDGNNKFYIDSSNYGFNSKLENEYNGPRYKNHYIKKSSVSDF